MTNRQAVLRHFPKAKIIKFLGADLQVEYGIRLKSKTYAHKVLESTRAQAWDTANRLINARKPPGNI